MAMNCSKADSDEDYLQSQYTSLTRTR